MASLNCILQPNWLLLSSCNSQAGLRYAQVGVLRVLRVMATLSHRDRVWFTDKVTGMGGGDITLRCSLQPNWLLQ